MRYFQRVLDKYAIPAENIEILEIENRPDMDEIQDYMKSVTGGRSVRRSLIITEKPCTQLQRVLHFNL